VRFLMGSQTKKRSWRHRGSCPVCGFRQNLLKDRVTVAQHKVYSGSEGRTCEGSGQPEKFAEANQIARDAWSKLVQVTTTAPAFTPEMVYVDA